MIFLIIIGFFVYFLSPVIIVGWLFTEKIKTNLDPFYICMGTLVLEIALFVQVLDWLGLVTYCTKGG